MNITRRAALGGIAAISATGGTSTANASSPEERALHHWRELCKAIAELEPGHDRFLLIGNYWPAGETRTGEPSTGLQVEVMDWTRHETDGRISERTAGACWFDMRDGEWIKMPA